MTPAGDLPLLTFDSFSEGRRFEPVEFEASPELVADFVAATGDDDSLYTDPAAARAAGFEGPILPPGLAGVWARLAYAHDHRLPAGGVMAGQSYRLDGGAPVGRAVRLEGEVAGPVEPEDPKRKVTFECRARLDDDIVGQVRIDARWGAEEA